jgi:hypothetical protein
MRSRFVRAGPRQTFYGDLVTGGDACLTGANDFAGRVLRCSFVREGAAVVSADRVTADTSLDHSLGMTSGFLILIQSSERRARSARCGNALKRPNHACSSGDAATCKKFAPQSYCGLWTAFLKCQRFSVARMPKYAKIQNFRNRKTPRSAVTFFNSPLGLWLLSAIFLTVGGAALSGRQECLASAESNIENFNRISREFFSRRIRLEQALLDSSNIIDFRKAVRSNAFANFKEFDGRSIDELNLQLRSIVAQFAFPKEISDEYEKLIVPPLTTSTITLDFMMYGGKDTVTIYDNELKQSQRDFKLDRYRLLYLIEANFNLKPACSFWRLAKRVIFDDNKMIVAAGPKDALLQEFKKYSKVDSEGTGGAGR